MLPRKIAADHKDSGGLCGESLKSTEDPREAFQKEVDPESCNLNSLGNSDKSWENKGIQR